MYRLTFKWTVSRGRDTYGYNICSLWVDGNKVSSCNGGGYDMKGTAFGNWVEEAWQDELQAKGGMYADTFYEADMKGEFIGRFDKPEAHGPTGWIQAPESDRFYGMSAYCAFNGTGWKIVKVHLDGACGFESIRKIVQHLGLDIQYVAETKNTTSYIMADKAAVEALHGIRG